VLIEFQKIIDAQKRIDGVVVNTPFSYAPFLSEIAGCEVFLKKENLQNTGAFKLRGAYNKIASLSSEQRSCGVVAASAGNHAQGVAFSAAKFNTKAFIVMPESTPLTKINGVKHFGAEVILSGSNYDEAFAYATKYGKENSLTFVHPFEDEEVMAGQGTVALEILEKCEELDAVLIPVGGGGLIAGMASVFKAKNKNIEVIGNIKLATLPKITKALQKPSSRIITAGSTHQSEEELILDAWNNSMGKLIIVPRHP
jgi:threonine dehydratase